MQNIIKKVIIIFFRVFIIILPLVFLSTVIDNRGTEEYTAKKLVSPFELVESHWIDSLMNNLTLDEKIAQLFMYPVYSNQTKRYEKNLLKLIQEQKIGGIILMQGSPRKHAKLTNELQANSKVPLMVAIDGEWGIAMRVDSVNSFPKAMALGAVQNDQLIYDLGRQIARQCKQIGVHVNFGPVLDINTNYNNPIINIRSFGDNGKNVARKGLAYAIGMQDEGILAVGKHFPGHGSTFTDSHKTLPIVYASKEQLLNIEIEPFRKLINNELGGVMVAHIAFPALDPRKNVPASLSSIVVDSLLKSQLGFKGLIFTDALNMKGVTKYHEPGQIEVEALLAGNDVLLYSENVKYGIEAIKNAIAAGTLLETEIEDKCRKILKAKQWFGLNKYEPISDVNLLDNINTIESKKINTNLLQSSITLIKNTNELLPIGDLDTTRILGITFGGKNSSNFLNQLKKYGNVDTISVSKWISLTEQNKILDTISHYNNIIIGHLGISEWPFSKFTTSAQNIKLIEKIASLKPSSLCFFGNPYALKYYNNMDVFYSIMIAYADGDIEQSLMGQAIFGGVDVSGKLPITINDKFKSGYGISFNSSRLGYCKPFEFGLPDSVFFKVDSIAQAAINMKATPGCQIVYAKNGKIVYDKTFGYHTYSEKRKVGWDDVYDIASVTKVAATTISLMSLYENNKIDPAAKISKYLPYLHNTDKKSVRINQLLSHHSGLRSWIPFYRNTLTSEGELRADLYDTEQSSDKSIKVADKLFLRNDYVDSVYTAIIDTHLYKKKKYRYSDLGFYLLADLIKVQTGELLSEYADKTYYSPLGMDNTCFNAWENINYTKIIPSEHDKLFRKQIVKGYVHDQGAALLGGVAGHAGMFANANDLAKLGQLLLNSGMYGNKQYFNPKTLAVFNKAYYKRKGNRRALGFDKPALKPDDSGPTCNLASQQSFGHTGFTGTYFWIDPQNQSVFVFLSNRTYPNQENKKLVKHDIRTNIQKEFYEIFKE